tara:strand:+ start:1142 stop:1939 length:798 start_codon:yes stop_codon:yes gene_type:complete
MVDLISIAIPTFDRVDFLIPLIISIRSKCELIPIIVVDDCSNDSTIPEIKKLQKNFKNIHLIQNSINRGRSNSRNIALKSCNTKYIFFLDSDDKLIETWPSVFAEAINLFDQLSESISTITFNLNFSGFHYINKYFEYNYAEQALYNGKFLCSCSSGLHKLSVLKNYSFDPEMDICEDIKLWIELCTNYNFFHIPRTISLYKPSKGNISFKKKIKALLNIDTNSVIQDQLIYNLIFSSIINNEKKFSIKSSKLFSFIWYVLKFFK